MKYKSLISNWTLFIGLKDSLRRTVLTLLHLSPECHKWKIPGWVSMMCISNFHVITVSMPFIKQYNEIRKTSQLLLHGQSRGIAERELTIVHHPHFLFIRVHQVCWCKRKRVWMGCTRALAGKHKHRRHLPCKRCICSGRKDEETFLRYPRNRRRDLRKKSKWKSS